MTPALSLTHVIERLRQARTRVASGWPTVALALAGPPVSNAQARLQEAEDARHATNPPPWALVLTEALALTEEAREAWGAVPDTMPPMAADLAPCGAELRLYLAAARAASEKGPAWEDSGGLTRAQGLCVLHLAVCLAQWRALEERNEANARQARSVLEQERRESSAVAARAIWGGQLTPATEPVKELCSLRDLAHVSSAFADWGEDE